MHRYPHRTGDHICMRQHFKQLFIFEGFRSWLLLMNLHWKFWFPCQSCSPSFFLAAKIEDHQGWSTFASSIDFQCSQIWEGTSSTFPDEAMPCHLALSLYLLAANLAKSVVNVSLMLLLFYCSCPITLSDASLKNWEEFSSPTAVSDASLAQLAEHALRKRMVMGSIPIGGCMPAGHSQPAIDIGWAQDSWLKSPEIEGPLHAAKQKCSGALGAGAGGILEKRSFEDVPVCFGGEG